MTRLPVARVLTGLAVLLLVAGCTSSGGSLPTIPPATPVPSESATPGPTHPGPTYPPGCPTSQPAPLGANDVRTVTLSTAKGDIVVQVKGSLSPIATGNFVALASCGYYDGVVFHRLVPGFVIQGGDGQFGRSPDVVPGLMGTGGPPYTIQDEPVTAAYARGTVAMAKTGEPNSASSQFFIILSAQGAGGLEARYQVIGTVTSGMDAVDAIAAMPNSGDATGNQALDPVPMTKVTVSNP